MHLHETMTLMLTQNVDQYTQHYVTFASTSCYAQQLRRKLMHSEDNTNFGHDHKKLAQYPLHLCILQSCLAQQ